MTAPLLTVDRVHARYRIASDAPAGTRERLDAILGEVVAGSLASALRRLGVEPREEICIDTVAARIRLRLGATDAAAGAAWGAGIADAIGRALATGGPGVVRYASRRQALADVVAGFARDDLARMWAWRQLGLWQAAPGAGAEQAAAEVVRALRGDPEAIAPVLASVARAGLFSPFACRVGAGGLVMIAAAALEAVGASVAAALVASRPATVAAGAPLERGASGSAATAATRIAGASSIAAAVAAGPASAVDEPVVRNALAALAVLECEPAALRSSEAATAALIATVAALVRGRPRTVEGAGHGPDRPASPPEDTPKHRTAGGGAPPRDTRAEPGPARAESAQPGGDAPPRETRAEPGPARAESAQASGGTPATPHGERAPGQASEHDGDVEDGDTAAADFGRTRAQTQSGGVLFLLHVVDELDLAAALADAPELAARSPRWTLHRLAMALARAGRDDPAALAFAGLGPDERPPGVDGPEPDEHERDAIAAAAGRVVRRLRERLDRPDDPGAALLRDVCSRRAEIVHDPGWIEARLRLEDVSLELRGAGLDLDPGWLPWLGTVVRFVYA